MLPNPPRIPSDPLGFERVDRRDQHPQLLQTNLFDPDLHIIPTFIRIKTKTDAD